MKDIALQKTEEAKDENLNILKEYLQNYILFLMQKVGVNTSLYFVGGTALRFLHRIQRYSEALDLLYEAGLTLQES
jgi:predicted nucleotidyltransferase component of viral defense system